MSGEQKLSTLRICQRHALNSDGSLQSQNRSIKAGRPSMYPVLDCIWQILVLLTFSSNVPIFEDADVEAVFETISFLPKNIGIWGHPYLLIVYERSGCSEVNVCVQPKDSSNQKWSLAL